jgi:hypothetical protein
LFSIKEETIYDTKEYDNKLNRQKALKSKIQKPFSKIFAQDVGMLIPDLHLELSGKTMKDFQN